MTRLLSAAIAAFFFIAGPAFGLVIEDDINAAYYANDAGALEELRAELDTTSASDAYLAAYIDWRIAGIQTGQGDDKAADKALKRGQIVLEELVEQTPESAEAWALLSTTYGMRIGIKPMRGMTLGRKSNAAIDKAMALEPSNPRVLLVYAIGKLNTPALWGGGFDEAMDAIDRSLESIATQGSGRYAWGEADAYIWRGIAEQRDGNAAAAAENFQRALAAEPDYSWAAALSANVE